MNATRTDPARLAGRGLALALLLGSTACATVPVQPTTSVVDAGSQPRADVNPTYAPGRVNLPSIRIPTLQEVQEKHGTVESKGFSSEDRLQAPALRDQALTYGAQAGNAWGAKQIDEMLEDRASELSKTYDFNRFLIRDKGVTILPPVISGDMDNYEPSDAGRTLRVADRYYKILRQSTFAPVAPLWRTYLYHSYSKPEEPAVLAKTQAQRDMWRQFSAEGWEKGLEQSRIAFQISLRRLDQDYQGMIRYSELLEKGMVSKPVLAEQSLGVTGTGTDMRQNDRVYRITRDPRLNVDHPRDYKAPVSTMDPSEAATPPDEPTGQHPD